MERDIREVVIGESLARDVFSNRGVLLLRVGVILNQNIKSLLYKHHVITVIVRGGLTV